MTTTTADTTTRSAPGAPEIADAHDPRAPAPGARSFVIWLAGIAGVGLTIRLMNVLWWRPTTDRIGFHGYRLWGDAFYYHYQANALADGKFFINGVRYARDGVAV